MKAKLATIALLLIVPAVATLTAPASYAQGSAPAATAAPQPASLTKAQKKAARKQARAKKNAELKKLQDAGYNPARANDPNYPQDLQNAQKKAGIGQGASQ
jgi:predicted Rossmann fold nucleotide-binding protein DprA/Smf involved in DNA uptake